MGTQRNQGPSKDRPDARFGGLGQAYLLRTEDGRPRLLRPTAESTGEEPAPVLRADLVWQLEVPQMQWSGATICHSSAMEQAFSLRDSVSGEFLVEQDGKVAFSTSDDQRFAHWVLRPFDEGTTVFECEKTKFTIGYEILTEIQGILTVFWGFRA